MNVFQSIRMFDFRPTKWIINSRSVYIVELSISLTCRGHLHLSLSFFPPKIFIPAGQVIKQVLMFFELTLQAMLTLVSVTLRFSGVHPWHSDRVYKQTILIKSELTLLYLLPEETSRVLESATGSSLTDGNFSLFTY